MYFMYSGGRVGLGLRDNIFMYYLYILYIVEEGRAWAREILFLVHYVCILCIVEEGWAWAREIILFVYYVCILFIVEEGRAWAREIIFLYLCSGLKRYFNYCYNKLITYVVVVVITIIFVF